MVDLGEIAAHERNLAAALIDARHSVELQLLIQTKAERALAAIPVAVEDDRLPFEHAKRAGAGEMRGDVE